MATAISYWKVTRFLANTGIKNRSKIVVNLQNRFEFQKRQYIATKKHLDELYISKKNEWQHSHQQGQGQGFFIFYYKTKPKCPKQFHIYPVTVK